MDWLSQVAKSHKDWVRVVHTFGEHFYAEDLVQEAYLKLHRLDKEKAVIVNGEVNKYYVFLTLRSIYIDFVKQKNKVKKVPINEETLPAYEHIDTDNFEAYENLMDSIDTEIENWSTFDKTLFNVYKNKNISMREIANGSNISLRTIFISLADSKKRIKTKLNKEYEDYKCVS